MLIAFIIIFVEIGGLSSDRLQNSVSKGKHHIMGIVVFVLALLQPLLAWVRKLKKNQPEKNAKIHSFLDHPPRMHFESINKIVFRVD